MSASNSIWRAFRLLALFALGFALAGCAAQKGAPSKPGAGGGAGAKAARGESTSAARGTSAAGGGKAEAASRPERKAIGEVEIRKSWVQVRAKPSQNSAAIALAFGNDTFPVLERQGDWVQVRLDKNREGWIPVSATER